jgi:hypothetical protein
MSEMCAKGIGWTFWKDLKLGYHWAHYGRGEVKLDLTFGPIARNKMRSKFKDPGPATTRYLYVVCIYGAICLQILFLKHLILLFCHEMLKFFA